MHRHTLHSTLEVAVDYHITKYYKAQPTSPSPFPTRMHQEKDEVTAEASTHNDPEVLHTFTILALKNAPDNTSSFGLILWLDVAVDQTGANPVAPTFLPYEYNPSELETHDNILVRDPTPEETTNY